MWQCGPLAALVALCCGSMPAGAESFTIRSPSAVDRIVYFLTGSFGGYGGSVVGPEKDGSYVISLEREGKPSKNLKAILYAAGCQFDVLSVELLSNPTRSATFECRQLPLIPLRGRLSRRRSDLGPLDVEVRYVASWDHKFFGLADGFVETFVLGSAPLDAEGRFQFHIPDFSKDDITIQMEDAYLEVLVRQHIGNVLGELLPSPDLQYQGIGLKILPSYEFEVTFRERR